MRLGANQKFATPEEALRHYGVKGMKWGVRKRRESSPREPTASEKYLAENDLGRPFRGENYALKKPQSLRVDTSRGYTDITPTKGLRTPGGEDMHRQMVETFEALRKEYPAVRELNVEIAPMGRMPGVAALTWGGCGAFVTHFRPGDVRICYNEKYGLIPEDTAEIKKQMPGYYLPNYTGRHEMGHVLAATGRLMPPGFEKNPDGSRKTSAQINKAMEQAHVAAFERHGMTFKELAKLGDYAASKPSEALAELYGHYATPELRSTLSPELQRKAKSLFDELGGKT